MIDTGGKLYPVLHIDPPWRWYARSAKGMGRSAERHYATMPLEEIKALGIPAARDATVYLWAVPCMIDQAIDVLRAWGLQQKGEIIWKKPMGKGLRIRGCHESLLVGTRGRPAPLAYKPPSVIEAPRPPGGRHSAKPTIFAEIIERIHPGQDKIELFARGCREGWDSWGSEAGPALITPAH
jgi:N6-adenosine-specific RNA methylase IME4